MYIRINSDASYLKEVWKNKLRKQNKNIRLVFVDCFSIFFRFFYLSVLTNCVTYEEIFIYR